MQLYNDGDIMLSFYTRTIYIYDLKTRSKHYSDMIATDEEEKVIKEKILINGKKTATFKELKSVMPKFNAKTRNGRIYSKIELTEHAFLFFRYLKTREPLRSSNLSDFGILEILLDSHLQKFAFWDNSREFRKIAHNLRQALVSISKLENGK